MKKKRMMTALLTTAMVFGAVPTAFAADNITVTVDGQKVSFGDQQPVNINGRVMVPVRAVAEKMGWDVEWFTYYGNTVVDGQFQQEHDIVLKNIVATVYKGNIIKNLIMDCQSYTKYRPNETTGGIFVSWRRKEELPTGA